MEEESPKNDQPSPTKDFRNKFMHRCSRQIPKTHEEAALINGGTGWQDSEVLKMSHLRSDEVQSLQVAQVDVDTPQRAQADCLSVLCVVRCQSNEQAQILLCGGWAWNRWTQCIQELFPSKDFAW